MSAKHGGDGTEAIGTALAVRVQWGAMLELLAVVLALLHKDRYASYDLDRAWFVKLSAEHRSTVDRLRAFAGGSDQVWEHLIGLATEFDGHEIGAFADFVGQMDAGRLRLELLGRRSLPIQRTVGVDRIEAAAEGDFKAQRDFLRLAWREDTPWQTGLRWLLKRPGAEIQAELARLLRALGRDIAPYIEPWLPALEADAADKRDSAPRRSPLELIRETIDTTYVPTGDVKAVTLIPSVVLRPHVCFIEQENETVFIYPVAVRFLGSVGAEPPDRLVRLAAALGDHGRLRILAALKEREMSIKDLGSVLGLPRSTLRHHLGILRGAGLIRPTEIGVRLSAYQVREEAATDLAELVDEFLGTPPRPR